MKIKSWKEIRPYAADPHQRVLIDLDIAESGVACGLSEKSELPPIEDRVRGLLNHLMTSDQIAEFEHVADALGGDAPYVLLCESLASGAFVEYIGVEENPSMEGIIPPFVAFNGSLISRQEQASPIDFLLRALAQQYFAEKTPQFAAFLNWQRLRCGLLANEGGNSLSRTICGGHDDPDSSNTWLVLASEIARQLAVSTYPPRNVAALISEAFWYLSTLPDLVTTEAMAIYVSGLLDITVFATNSDLEL